MTRKMTITLEDTLLDELDSMAISLGKKKSQIVREALNSYLNLNSKEEKIKKWQEENKDAIKNHNKRLKEHGIILEEHRIF
ncbi:type II toxin-antitoxin system CcdA family antitoxin [Poseidonibacter antarcticus]|uniref:type II toxin-antitoxin system CcdA family antitoxin n=1 Tax=Poseidonibacter antarcticus TaxID=2478538 RepID=UPI0013CEAD59|nr:type II toxin-antitoxin system CcdA family antitoxin [Poseidonibacter antarcticus]